MSLLMPKPPSGTRSVRALDETNVFPMAQFLTKRGCDENSGSQVAPGSQVRDNIAHVGEATPGAGGKRIDEKMHHRWMAIVSGAGPITEGGQERKSRTDSRDRAGAKVSKTKAKIHEK